MAPFRSSIVSLVALMCGLSALEGQAANITTTTKAGTKACASSKLSATTQALVDPYKACYEACPGMCISIEPTLLAYLTAPAKAGCKACEQKDAWKCTVSKKVVKSANGINQTAAEICKPGGVAMKAAGLVVPDTEADVDKMCSVCTTTTTTTTKKKAENNVSASHGLVVSMTGFALILVTMMV
eukprot:TRINITY_DN9277_c0_g1_i1.p1 TRINITY_DN9277_c0_g1~~TRINITY_DN9277_c0_g1_i1.p1  ORF type:complete len:184 (+),score=33.04 TRINITY_DN9277_c0_g1_i1:83-634(+)